MEDTYTILEHIVASGHKSISGASRSPGAREAREARRASLHAGTKLHADARVRALVCGGLWYPIPKWQFPAMPQSKPACGYIMHAYGVVRAVTSDIDGLKTRPRPPVGLQGGCQVASPESSGMGGRLDGLGSLFGKVGGDPTRKAK